MLSLTYVPGDVINILTLLPTRHAPIWVWTVGVMIVLSMTVSYAWISRPSVVKGSTIINTYFLLLIDYPACC